MMLDTRNDRPFWVSTLVKIAQPVLSTLAEGKLRERMPVEACEGFREERSRFTHLEALGRSLAGIGPWLNLAGLEGEEENTRRTFQALVQAALEQATDPTSPDFMNFREGQQPIVDAAFLAQGLLRSYDATWRSLSQKVQTQIVACLKQTRTRKPHFNNWLLFSALTEAFLCKAGQDWDRMRVDYAIRQHEQWYLGDGVYGDGPSFHWDYYNSFVTHPMLLDILDAVSTATDEWEAFRPIAMSRAQRYAVIQERWIAPDGSFPPMGRSLAYRFGAFHLLASMALRQALPPELDPAQVRCALTAVIQKVMRQEGTFDQQGWLTIGLCGHQPSLGEPYVSTGSLYLCLCGLLPLGLPPDNEFWSSAPADWSSRKIWAGQDAACDHALSETKSPTLGGINSSASSEQRVR
jgi:hypothetical protein